MITIKLPSQLLSANIHSHFFPYQFHFSQIPLAVPFKILNICILPIQACKANTEAGTISIPSIP